MDKRALPEHGSRGDDLPAHLCGSWVMPYFPLLASSCAVERLAGCLAWTLQHWMQYHAEPRTSTAQHTADLPAVSQVIPMTCSTIPSLASMSTLCIPVVVQLNGVLMPAFSCCCCSFLLQLQRSATHSLPAAHTTPTPLHTRLRPSTPSRGICLSSCCSRSPLPQVRHGYRPRDPQAGPGDYAHVLPAKVCDYDGPAGPQRGVGVICSLARPACSTHGDP